MSKLDFLVPRIVFLIGMVGIVVSANMLFGTVTSGIVLCLFSFLLIGTAIKSVIDE